MAEREPLPEREVREIRHLRGSREESVRQVSQELVSDVGDLIRNELELAKREIQVDLRALVQASVLMTLGALGAFFGVLYLLLAAIFGLANVIAPWLSSVAIGGGVLILGLILAWIGWARLKAIDPLPEQTIDTLREDVDWLRNRMR